MGVPQEDSWASTLVSILWTSEEHRIGLRAWPWTGNVDASHQDVGNTDALGRCRYASLRSTEAIKSPRGRKAMTDLVNFMQTFWTQINKFKYLKSKMGWKPTLGFGTVSRFEYTFKTVLPQEMGQRHFGPAGLMEIWWSVQRPRKFRDKKPRNGKEANPKFVALGNQLLHLRIGDARGKYKHLQGLASYFPFWKEGVQIDGEKSLPEDLTDAQWPI